MILTELEIEVIRSMLSGHFDTLEECIQPEEWQGKAECRERDECIQKLKRLGLIT